MNWLSAHRHVIRGRLGYYAATLSLLAGVTVSLAAPAHAGAVTATSHTEVPGISVAEHDGAVDWPRAVEDGARFAYVQATIGTGYTNPYFEQQYDGAADAGLIRGAYHFADPSDSSGAAQARFFVNNGGGWSADGQTLPPLLDIEYNPYGGTCYGLSDGQMVNWIADFSNTLKRLTGRYPVIYTTTSWWATCTGDYGGFADTNPLYIGSWGDSIPPIPPIPPDPPLPAGWETYTFRQGPGGTAQEFSDWFHGDYSDLITFAEGG